MEAVKAVQNAIDYMEEHLYEHVELEQIAAAAYMSVPSMYRIFYALTGHPLKEYIRKRRTSQAAIMLRQSKLPVVDIAVACGFESYQAFTKSFKKLVGLTPGSYRDAVLYYSFEKVNLLEKVHYSERREVSEQYPDVKVIRTAPMNVLSFKYRASLRAGLEEQAFHAFYQRLAESDFPLNEARIIGRNLEKPSGCQKEHEYELMAAYPQQHLPHPLPDDPDLQNAILPGGLYAVSLTPADAASTIIASWNRMLAEWLPKSTFTLGEHSFLEEWMHYKGRVTRLKLMLPVERVKEQPSIEVMELASVPLRVFRSYGAHSPSLADERLTAWLTEQELRSDDAGKIQLYMFANYGMLPSSDEYWYELGVSLPHDPSALPDENTRVVGGLYACLTTPAYGAMTGVMDKLYSWLYQNENYEHDESRQGYARYTPGAPDNLERTTSVTTCIPVRLLHSRKELRNGTACKPSSAGGWSFTTDFS
ncbi:helix-turn-helix domain-containing protein [Paenibacillus solisilvae]|uniref:Helix-turn-helix domain-containing protein n=1 Tax=Paenibacillus solisilvae TaxID=2486751 RepID=A0ABW0VXP5_9BACL